MTAPSGGLTRIWSDGWPWLRHLAAHYGVNPVTFAVLYIGAIPLTIVAVAWAVRNHRTGRGTLVPVGLACLFYSSASLYVVAVGRGLPLVAYLVLGLILAYGIWAVSRSVRRKTGRNGASGQP